MILQVLYRRNFTEGEKSPCSSHLRQLDNSDRYLFCGADHIVFPAFSSLCRVLYRILNLLISAAAAFAERGCVAPVRSSSPCGGPFSLPEQTSGRDLGLNLFNFAHSGKIYF